MVSHLIGLLIPVIAWRQVLYLMKAVPQMELDDGADKVVTNSAAET